jgi:hypothetical protein
MKLRHLNILLSSILIAGLMSSCYPDKIEDIEDLDIVQTQYDVSFNFDERMYYLLILI